MKALQMLTAVWSLLTAGLDAVRRERLRRLIVDWLRRVEDELPEHVTHLSAR